MRSAARALLVAACVLVSSRIASAQTAVLEAELVPSVVADGDWYGVSVAVSGDTALVGAERQGAPGIYTGAVFVFVRGTGGWAQQARIGPPDGHRYFGHAVALDGDVAVIGAFDEASQGRAHVYARTGTTWSEVAVLAAPTPETSSLFGWAVAISGDTVAVSEPLADRPGRIDHGEVHLFARAPDGTWPLQQTLFVLTSERFGDAIDLDGNTLVVGEPLGGSMFDSGGVHVYVRSGTTWSLERTLEAPAAYRVEENWFGAAVAISGDLLLVGAPHNPADWAPDHVSYAHFFTRTGTSWTWRVARGGAGQGLAESVALDGTLAVLGSPESNPGGVDDAGSVQVCRYRSSPVPSVGCSVAAITPVAHAGFGRSVAVDGRYVVGGATPLIGWPGTGEAYAFRIDEPLGAACTSAADCATGHCVDGVCCDDVCGGGALDCRACSIAAGGTTDGTCGPLATGATVTCRAASGPCDVAETCSASSTSCPADVLASAGTSCRAVVGACDAEESCTGASASCPADARVAAGTTCRASAGACDVAEMCNGTSVACPADAFADTDTTCRASEGACDVAETCTGASSVCPADVLASAGTTCRVSAGACDVAETCTGSSSVCPADVLASAGTTCRASAGTCDAPETCTGTSASCAADVLASAGTTCRASAGACDLAETCTGTSAWCGRDLFVPDGNACDDGLACNGAETCSAGMCASGPSPECDDGDACTADACDDAGGCTHEPILDCCAADADCDDGNACTIDACVGMRCTAVTDPACADAGLPDAAVPDDDDAAVPQDVDGGSRDASAGRDAGAPSRTAGGCSCRAESRSARSPAPIAAALVLLALVPLRRRARRG